MAPRWPQEAPKRPPRGPQAAPRGPPEALKKPKSPPGPPRDPPDVPRCLQEAPKRYPKSPPRRSKRFPKRLLRDILRGSYVSHASSSFSLSLSFSSYAYSRVKFGSRHMYGGLQASRHHRHRCYRGFWKFAWFAPGRGHAWSAPRGADVFYDPSHHIARGLMANAYVKCGSCGFEWTWKSRAECYHCGQAL